MTAWLRSGLEAYDEDHDALGNDNTSRLSPYLHFGALSPLEVVRRVGAKPSPAAQAFVRQVAWRDFYAQVLAARPDVTHCRLPVPRRPLAPQRRGARGLEGGPHRLPDRRRRHAPAARARAGCTTGPA